MTYSDEYSIEDLKRLMEKFTKEIKSEVSSSSYEVNNL